MHYQQFPGFFSPGIAFQAISYKIEIPIVYLPYTSSVFCINHSIELLLSSPFPTRYYSMGQRVFSLIHAAILEWMPPQESSQRPLFNEILLKK